MERSFALFAVITAIASPALSQSGIVTYPVSGHSLVPGATSVTINYSAETITWHFSGSEFDYTEANGSEANFESRAAILESLYGSQRIVTPSS